MYNKHQLGIIAANAEAWGQQHAEDRLLEEMGELTTAIFHLRRGKNEVTKDELLGELADVITCANILALTVDDSNLTTIKAKISGKIRLCPDAAMAEDVMKSLERLECSQSIICKQEERLMGEYNE